jgi:hypothetical protein
MVSVPLLVVVASFQQRRLCFVHCTVDSAIAYGQKQSMECKASMREGRYLASK